ncbi:Penicillin-binding protein 2 [uncultured Roseburia sp.]|uniref:Penicillin-binding transpeptidase domain-containing protein n=1 Tax=Brotonthovivens ammoniilytica TaxID=2981725 RepID=A0ABT2TFF3_9FIRM|nr:penicillin-binding transpeptidase domain-containing protein [Brotonthovivens ammoniilytica]MCU6760925.1 penicillin-binding transpeptidase domain-containing protein [Brotonthovivens ammoniilytica]SCI13593.1 Penicillin-binding protein 2 [uncultured Roseburia sp.]
MQRLRKYQRKKMLVFLLLIVLGLCAVSGKLVYLMIFKSEFYGEKAENLHERERSIKAARGKILDRNGTVLASNKSVCTISVIHNQIEDEEAVIDMLVKELGLEEKDVRKRVEKVSSIERIKTNVDKETGDKILEYGMAGVKVDADYKRYYPYDELASRVLGFTGSDNQGIVGLEVKYDQWLSGTNGKILTLTDARGIEVEAAGERRQEPKDGNDVVVSLDHNIQEYCQQAAEKVMEEKKADAVGMILMNPQNGEIYAMVNVPEFNLNEPFTLTDEVISQGEEAFQEKKKKEQEAKEKEDSQDTSTEDKEEKKEETFDPENNSKQKQELLNQMWRNMCINDTYEPGSTFKIITTSAALEEGVVTTESQFYCPGYKMVEDRRIRCHKTTGHGAETFTEGIMNSCNPVFIELGLRLGVDNFYKYFKQFGLLQKTNIDLPGEASTIMHDPKNMGQVELATVAFGQSFQITPVQLVTTVSSLINGGTRITPHFGVQVQDSNEQVLETFQYDQTEDIVSEETSKTLRSLLEKVVSEGTGRKGGVEGFSVGGKTATSQTLPRSEHKYISSFLGFAPADDPKVIGLVVIYDPQGIYYGGTIAAPVMQEVFEDVLPYLGIEEQPAEETKDTENEQ